MTPYIVLYFTEADHEVVLSNNLGWLQYITLVHCSDYWVQKSAAPLQATVYLTSLLNFSWIEQDSKIEGISQQADVYGHSFRPLQ